MSISASTRALRAAAPAALILLSGMGTSAWAAGPLPQVASWAVESNQASAELGTSVATAGDVNGDGYSDVLVGDPRFDNGQLDEGRAFLYLGSAAGLATTPAWTAEPNQVAANFGFCVATAGDMNADGYDDVIVTAPSFDNGELNEGRVYVYLGSASGLPPTTPFIMDSNQPESQWGYSAATAGDVNGDGYSDVIIGAPRFGNDRYGIALLFSGSEGGPTLGPWGVQGQDDSWFGGSVGTAGDVNGDGYSDVIVGAQFHDNGQVNEGMAFIYLGSPAGLAFNPVWSAESNLQNAEFGSSVATAGDTDGDGYSDIIVGAAQYANTEQGEGAAFMYRGSSTGPRTNYSWTIESNMTLAHYGYSVATAGDPNGDGYADVIVGATQYSNDQLFEGRGFLYIGSADGLSTMAVWTGEGNQLESNFGACMATAGDVNGDGYSDVIVGIPNYTNGQINEGQARAYYGSAFGSGAFPRFTIDSGDDGALFGSAVSTAGDVNGDGYSDFVIGAPYADNELSDEGSAYILMGAYRGVLQGPGLHGIQADAHLGSSVASAGDVNGDGYSDVIIGAPNFANGQIGEGRAFVHLGSSAGLAITPAWTAESNQTFAQFGWSVAGAGDVNGDGFSDVIVGAYQYENGHDDEGRAYVYLGSASGLAGTPAWTAESNQGSSGFGYSVGSAGDVNGDGFSDVIVGCYLFDNGQNNEGRAFVYHGSASGLAASPAWTAESNQGSGDFGFSVASAGDVNGDGYSDVIVGADTYDNGHGDEGRAYVYRGSATGLVASPLWTGESNQVGAQFGFSVASAGDVNGDGFSDVVIGSPFFDNGLFDEGAAFVYHGSSTGPAAAPSTTIESIGADAWFGYSVASMGDVAGDGFSDVIVGAPTFGGPTEGGRIAGHYGNGEISLDAGTNRIARQARVNGSAPIALLGRSPQTAFLATALGRTAAGRGKVRMEIEVKRLGVPFNGQGLEQSVVTDTGAPAMIVGSAASISEAVFGLQANAAYRWRMRITANSPFFPSTPWLSMPGNGFTETDFRTGGVVIGIEPEPSAATPMFLDPIYPNPFAPPGEIAYSLPAALPVRLAVYDVQGRARAVLVEGVAESGHHVVRWDARGSSGARLEAGVYFVRLTAGDRVETRKVTLVR